ncbi:Uncharacterised protein [Mycobacteroides abscessus subsp. massiliense]|nr:Uncharacterised protein [Mycobacteroides abscessus subsp. massiliense]
MTVDAHLTLRHRFQQCRLRFGRRPVDLIGQEKIREDGPRPEFERPGRHVIDGGTQQIRGQ